MAIKRYIIEFEKPEGAAASEVKDYIQEALKYWGGQFNPYNPFFDGLDVVIKREKPGGK